ncbi:hypothetical protein CXG81DRAFT_25135 [Caulochytrium protostelioides]|uniref:Mitochondrial distribution and morphology protein 12 n=1 Tax=Caulochytrium protostelioides TaxID=1555241 RepID=A0A4P9XA46_9FUNG|nr:hypothetical protein CXG81DRAFT_25135 [Caulochytrium protostelioides]|eukprot:RKP02196.1 hypothetical protein CXG81DRAFT_25135 [Caulochytrium protostelioides]
MSFKIDWELLSDGVQAARVCSFLNAHFSRTTLPPYLGFLRVRDCDFGSVPPDVTIVTMGDPLPEFYEDAMQERLARLADGRAQRLATAGHPGIDPSDPPDSLWSFEDDAVPGMYSAYTSGHGAMGQGVAAGAAPPHLAGAPYPRGENDVQVQLRLSYSGNFRLTLESELVIDQPTPRFIVLPITLRLTGFGFAADALVAYMGDHINFCIQEPPDETSLLQHIHIESEIGEAGRNVLKNVAQIEAFVVTTVRDFVDDFFVFPNYYSLDLLAHDSDERSSDAVAPGRPLHQSAASSSLPSDTGFWRHPMDDHLAEIPSYDHTSHANVEPATMLGMDRHTAPA